MPNSKRSEGEPELDAPGAGLPFIQEWILKYVAFPVLRRLVSRDRALAIFEREGREALTLLRDVPEELRYQRILLPRMMGIEDSSRYWSMAMALDHIMIVSNAVAELITKLNRGQQIDGVVSTANVKPSIDQPSSIETSFETFLTTCPGQITSCMSNDKVARCHVHPWFGCLNPDGWIVMLALHQWIHKRQLREMRKLLLAAVR